MSPQAAPSLETVVRSNEKLLKAMLALLSLKDEHFLAELKQVFALASKQGSELGDADPKIWAEISRELGLIDQIVNGDAVHDQDGDGGRAPGGEDLH